MNIKKLFPLLSIILLSATCALSMAQNLDSVVEDPLTIGTTLTFQSNILSEERKILVSMPENYHTSTDRYPVIYILDAQYQFIFQYAFGITKALTFLEKTPEVILVGIYNEDRNNDLTTPDSQYGGDADKFIDFFNNELKKYIENQYRTEPYNILIGHSAGGIFALYTLIQEPDTFNGYVAIDPAIQLANCRVLDDLRRAMEEGVVFNNALFTSMSGRYDETERHYKCHGDFIGMLNENMPEGLIFSHSNYPEEDHSSTIVPGIQDGLLAMYENFTPPDTINNLDTLVSHYQNLTKRYGYDIEVPMRRASQLGFTLVRNGDPAEALNIFEWYYENISQDAIAHYQLAFALRSLGRLPEALEELDKSLELGPGQEMQDFIVRMRDEVAQAISEQ